MVEEIHAEDIGLPIIFKNKSTPIIATFRVGEENYRVTKELGEYPDGGVFAHLGIADERDRPFSGIMVDWKEDDRVIAVCSLYEQSLEDMKYADSLSDCSKRTPVQHWDVVGNAILAVIDQSPKPIYWYTFGQPAGMRETHPLPAYEQLIASMVDHPLRNRVRAYVDQSEGIFRNFHYVVGSFAIDAITAQVKSPILQEE